MLKFHPKLLVYTSKVLANYINNKTSNIYNRFTTLLFGETSISQPDTALSQFCNFCPKTWRPQWSVEIFVWPIIYIIEDWWLHPLSGSSKLLWIKAFTGKAYRILNGFRVACDSASLSIFDLYADWERSGGGVARRVTSRLACVFATLSVRAASVHINNPTCRPPPRTISNFVSFEDYTINPFPLHFRQS